MTGCFADTVWRSDKYGFNPGLVDGQPDSFQNLRRVRACDHRAGGRGCRACRAISQEFGELEEFCRQHRLSKIESGNTLQSGPKAIYQFVDMQTFRDKRGSNQAAVAGKFDMQSVMEEIFLKR